MTRIRAIVAGLVLALAIAAPVSAATTSSSTEASGTVLATLSMSGVPATYNFGSGPAGQDLIGPNFTLTVVSSETAFTVSAASTNFTSGANTIQANRLYYNVNAEQKLPAAAGVPVALGTTTPLTVFMKLVPPAGTPAGVYTGTVTFTANN